MQQSLFTGQDLAIQGMTRAAEKADRECEGWQDMALGFLEDYVKKHRFFMAEDVRLASEGIVPTPPSLRAWGQIMMKASKRGIIKSVGIQKVNNPKAHSANATVWTKA